MNVLHAPDAARGVRSGCGGIVPLNARLEPWQVEL
ncbi:MAG: hypothetical protein QOH00_1042, partial [Gaiellales bacterium]|nr:hypothetical protein [Gaiellales bacterium]